MRTCQAAFIYFDSEMYYEPADQAALSRSWNLSDDLGQVRFLVSDKTGTLTQVGLSIVTQFMNCSCVSVECHGFPNVLSWWQDLRG